jgi:hypothetical protein
MDGLVLEKRWETLHLSSAGCAHELLDGVGEGLEGGDASEFSPSIGGTCEIGTDNFPTMIGENCLGATVVDVESHRGLRIRERVHL